jgi:hypothetical protein
MKHINALCGQNAEIFSFKAVACIISVSQKAGGHLYKLGLFDRFTYNMCQKSSEMSLCVLCYWNPYVTCVLLLLNSFVYA